MSWGMKAKITHKHFEEITLRNVTEVHYNYRRCLHHPPKVVMIAFESDIHNTGITYRMEHVLEFEVTPEVEIAKAF